MAFGVGLVWKALSSTHPFPLLDCVFTWYTPFSEFCREPYFPGLGKSHGMSGGEFMMGRFFRARDWQGRRAKSTEVRKNICYIQEGVEGRKCDSLRDEEKMQ